MFEKLIRVDLKKKNYSFNSLFNELTWIALFLSHGIDDREYSDRSR